ncbi:hypothetical protein QOT17_007356 [Balamuthia mandrillaris]
MVDPAVKAVFGASPPFPTSIPVNEESDEDLEQVAEEERLASMGGKQERASRKTNSSGDTLRITKDEKEKAERDKQKWEGGVRGTTGNMFQKDTTFKNNFSATNAAKESVMSKIIGSAAEKERKSQLAVVVYLYINHPPDEGEKENSGRAASSAGTLMQLCLKEHTTIGGLLKAVRGKLDAEGKPSKGKCTVRIAEEDGSPDEDIPALSEEQPLRKFGRRFAVVQTLAEGDVPSALNAYDKKLLKINLPKNEHQMVAYQGDMQIRTLLRRLCERRALDYTEHCLTQPDSHEALHPDTTLDKLPIPEVTLRSSVTGKPEGEAGDALAFWSDTNAFRFTEYQVTKFKRFGPNQERILGLEKDCITNNSLKKGHSTKRPMRSIKELKSATLLGDHKPRQFSLRFIDRRTYVYEAKTVKDAREIVAKLRYIKERGD